MSSKRAGAKFLGTFVLVFGGVGAAVIAGEQIGFLGVAFAGIPIGLVLVLVHLVGIPVDNTSVNPARSIGPALFVGDWAIEQLWLFVIAPLAGGILAAAVHRFLFSGVLPVVGEESAVAAQ